MTKRIQNIVDRFNRKYYQPFRLRKGKNQSFSKINLCCGPTIINNYYNIDIASDGELIIDLSRSALPFRDESMDVVVCISAINYFEYHRAGEIIRETHRVLKKKGIARFGVQDMKSLAMKYVENDTNFFSQKLPDGRDRFQGPTIGDKFAAWFYGYKTAGGPSRYFYDFDSLAVHFYNAGFTTIERRAYRDSRLTDVEDIDNRPDQMFFLEAVK
jgi:SAM-dependent methyltransferase